MTKKPDQIHCRLDAVTMLKLAQDAEHHDTTVSYIVRRILTEHYKQEEEGKS